MLRLANRLLGYGVDASNAEFPYDTNRDQESSRSQKAIHLAAWCIKRSPIIIADDVVAFCESTGAFSDVAGTRTWMHWDVPKGLPAGGTQWIEANVGNMNIGVAISERAAASETEAVWLMEIFRWRPTSDPRAELMNYTGFIRRTESEKGVWTVSDGLLIARGNDEWSYDLSDKPYYSEDGSAGAACVVAIATLAMTACSNITYVDAPVEVGPSRKWLNRMKQNEIKYKTLSIDPMNSATKMVRPAGSDHRDIPMHICRGHFATYSEDKPLFGKYAGRFWVPAHVKGSPEHGIVDKDYRIRLPGVSQ